MIGSIITRVLVMIFGYAYPAYECYKTVEMNKPSIEQLRFWCQYWILVAVLTVSERIGDTFISWVPMYSEAKLAFYIYLWYPKTMGTTYVYDSFFRPYLSRHESDIDRNLFELKTRAGDIAVLYCQKAASYGQTRIYDVLQYVAAQSTSKPRPAQNQQAAVARPSSATNRTPPPASEEPLSPASAAASSAEEEEAHEMSNSQASPAALLNAHKSVAAQSHVETSSSPSCSSGAETKQITTISSPVSDNNPPVKETAMEEAVRVTRGRLRKTRSAFNSV